MPHAVLQDKSKVPKPKRIKTLKNQIRNIFKREISEDEAEAILEKLIEHKIISCEGEAVFYK